MGTVYRQDANQDISQIHSDDYGQLLSELNGWSIITENAVDQLTKAYVFDDFIQALEFTNKVGALAERYNHHPRITTQWGKTQITWWTHTLNGLAHNDFTLAAKTDELIAETR